MSIQGRPMCGEWLGDLHPALAPLAVHGSDFSLEFEVVSPLLILI
jgi:hypothetical protein